MTACLPPNLLALFAPREPIPYLPPVDKASAEKKRTAYVGVGAFLKEFEDPKDAPAPVRVETREERRERRKRERQETMTYKQEQDLARWTPQEMEFGTDPYKTLFVARLNYDTSESKLRREFEQYGSVKSIKMVNDQSSGKSRGYAFVEFSKESDMNAAYKYADGKRIDDRRIVVDVERGRTVKGWKPRRLGGGRGGRKTGATDKDKAGGPPPADERPPGGPMRYNDRGGGDFDSRNRDNGRPPHSDRGGYNDRAPGGYGGDRGGNRSFDRNGDRGPMRDDRGYGNRDRNDDRSRDRGGDRGYGNGGGDKNNGGGTDRSHGGGGDRDRDRRRF